MSKAREFWVDYNPNHVRYNCTQHEEIVYKYEKVKVIEKSAYDKAVEALKVAQKEIQRLNMDAPLELTITTGRINLELIETLRELGVE